MPSPPIPAHPPHLASLPQLGTASSWDVGAGIEGDYAPWAEPAAATQTPADATAVGDKVAASVTAVDEESDINATAVEGVVTVSPEAAEEAAPAVVAQTLSDAAQSAATETPAAAASALAPAFESSVASFTVMPGIDAPESTNVPTVDATAQLHVSGVQLTSPAAALGPGSAVAAAADFGSDESRPQLPLTSTAVASDDLHGIVAVMEANSHAPAASAAASDVTAASGGGPSYLLASPGVASGDSESSSLGMGSDSAAAKSGMYPECAHEAAAMDRPAAQAADGQQLGMGTVQTHIQTAHVTLHGSTDTLETSAVDSTEDDLCGSTAADTEQVVAAGDLDAHMGTELADSFATSDAEGAELAKYVATSDAELSESMCGPSSESGAAVEAAADVDTADASMPVPDLSEAAEDAATSPQAGSLHEEQPAQQHAQLAKHDAQPAESVARHCPSVAPTAAAESGPIVEVAGEEHAAPGRAEMLEETVHDPHTTSAADVHSITEQDITNAAAAAEMPQTDTDGDSHRNGGLGISAETGEDCSSTSVVPSHGTFDSTLLLDTQESTLPGMLCMLSLEI